MYRNDRTVEEIPCCPIIPCYIFPMLTKFLRDHGWSYVHKTSDWRWIIRTSADTGTWFEVDGEMLMLRFDWYLSQQGIELVKSVTLNAEIKYIELETLKLLKLGYDESF